MRPTLEDMRPTLEELLEYYKCANWLELSALGIEGKLEPVDHEYLQASSGGHCDIAGAYVVILRRLDNLIKKMENTVV